MYFLVVSLFTAVLCFNLCYCQLQSEPNCEIGLFTNTELQENEYFQTAVYALLGEGGQPPITVSDFTVVCAAQGMTEGLYRAVSIVATFTLGSTPATRQYQTWCYNDAWFSIENTFPAPNTFDPPIRRDCYHCREGGVDPHNCLVCDICTDPGLAPNRDCSDCVVIDICLADNPCANGNCTLNSAPNNYTCDCAPGFTGTNCTICAICTDPGLVPNSDCNGCVVTDICLADNPCVNGNCTLNSAPNDYTCDCALEFTGTNCDTLVQSSSSSMSPTPTPTPVVCSVENCVECDLSDAMCCRSCSTGYEVDNCACVETTTCDIPNCVSCPTDDCCSECEDDYELDGCICTKNERSLSIYEIAGIIVAACIVGILVLLILTVVIIYMLYYIYIGKSYFPNAVKCCQHPKDIFIDLEELEVKNSDCCQSP